MKQILICLFILATQSHFLLPATFTPSLPQEFLELQNEGRYEECFVILQRITIDLAKLSLLIAAKQYKPAIPIIIRLTHQIVADIKCFKNSVSEFNFDRILESLSDPNECVMKHMKNAVAAIKIAIQDIQLGLYKEALKQVMNALTELGLAEQCPK